MSAFSASRIKIDSRNLYSLVVVAWWFMPSQPLVFLGKSLYVTDKFELSACFCYLVIKRVL